MKQPNTVFKVGRFMLINVFFITLSFNSLLAQDNARSSGVINIGSRLELFVDDFLIESLGGEAELRLHQPVPQNISILHDEPWEGNSCVSHTIFKDGDLFRMYYRGSQIGIKENGDLAVNAHPNYLCYAESKDGINWTKPKLNLYDFRGSKQNNIVLATEDNVDAGSSSVFKDINPGASPDARYKAMVRSRKLNGLQAFKSPDGIHWSPMSEQAIITDGHFDSQTIAFWDNLKGEYRTYWRSSKDGVRAIRTATSKDYIHWKNQTDLEYTDSPIEHLYESKIEPYYRAPHIYIGFPVRYVDRGWSESMTMLPNRKHRELRSIASERHGTALTEVVFMVSRNGVDFKRWNEAFLRPGIEREGTWDYGHLYIGWGVVETKSSLEGAPNEFSLYATESYWTGDSDALRRYTLRIDGFVSVNARAKGGELITKPLTFTGNKLVLNFSSSAVGGIQVEIQDETGKPISGFAAKDCPPIFGDTIERTVTWKNGNDLSKLEGRPVRLRFVLKDADLFSFRFK